MHGHVSLLPYNDGHLMHIINTKRVKVVLKNNIRMVNNSSKWKYHRWNSFQSMQNAFDGRNALINGYIILGLLHIDEGNNCLGLLLVLKRTMHTRLECIIIGRNELKLRFNEHICVCICFLNLICFDNITIH